MTPSGVTESSIHWLEAVLAERTGLPTRLGCSENSWTLMLSNSEGTVTFPRSNGQFPIGSSNLPCATWDPVPEGYASPLSVPLPAPGVDNFSSPLISKTADGYHIGYDLPGFVYWSLNRLEEIGRTDLDNHERFPAANSHAFRHGYLERPVVDEWIHVLKQVMQRQWPSLEFKQHAFKIMLSHDVDKPARYSHLPPTVAFRSAASLAIGKQAPREAWAVLASRFGSRSAFHPADPLNTFSWIMHQSEARGLQSAFYFICGRTDPKKDATYNPEDPRIRTLMRQIHARGHEIGLHPSYRTFRTPGAIASEADRLRRICAEEGIRQPDFGGRMHYLRWEHPATLAAWDAAGMTYDSSMGYADRPGFRAGTCFEYPGFDPLKDHRLEVRVRPLVAMECTVMAPRYLGLGQSDAAQLKFLELKRACRNVGGLFTLLWHNSELQTEAARNLYLKVLDED